MNCCVIDWRVLFIWPRMPLILGERVVIICAECCKTSIWYLPKESGYIFSIFLLPWRNSPRGARASSLSRLHDHTLGRLLWTSDLPVAETSTWLHTTLTREKIHDPAGFEPTIPAGEWPQSDALDRAATGTGISYLISNNKQLIQLYLYS